MTTPSFADFQTADRRLVLLRALAAAVMHRANNFLLRSFCDRIGHAVSTDVLAADLAWLREVGLVKLDTTEPGVIVAELTPRGLDVAEGRSEHPGVAKPRPV